MIFSSRKRTDSDFNADVSGVLECLESLIKRTSHVYEKMSKNLTLPEAIHCLQAMQNKIQVAAVHESAQILHRG